MCFWNTANKITIGIRATSEAASTRFHWSAKLEFRLAVPTDSTLSELELVTMSGHRKSFQPKTKASRTTSESSS